MTGSYDSLTDNDELTDSAESGTFQPAPIDWRLLTSSTVLGALGGIAFGTALLVWPGRTDRVLARLIGIGLIWFAANGLRSVLQRSPRSVRRLPGPLIALAAGVILVLNPDRSTVFIGRLMGTLLVVYVAYSLVGQWRRDRGDWSRTPFLATVGALGVLLILASGEFFTLIIAVATALLVALCVLVLVVSLDGRTEGTAGYADTSGLVLGWLEDRPKSADARQELYRKILYEGPNVRTRVIRFFVLMGFASVIASMGAITDSTAVVIGAMLIAPLMTPLMGMAISLVMGWPNRLRQSAALAFTGIAFAIMIGLILGLVSPTDIDTATNSQILARTSPTGLDLITAIAAGGAGAYGLSRPDVSDSLPGVAIAISLVPPLTVVGIAYSQGDVTAGGGALLLFATNMIAILIVGGLTFILTGVTPIGHAAEGSDRVRVALGATATLAIIVLGGLLLNGAQIAADALQEDNVQDAVEEWVPVDSGHRLVSVDLDDDVVEVVVVGPADGLPEVVDLADELSAVLDKSVTARVSLVVEETLIATGGAD
ncbi:MAG: DUF389 domain-containing protein [Actinomycetota bacterium]